VQPAIAQEIETRAEVRRNLGVEASHEERLGAASRDAQRLPHMLGAEQELLVVVQ